MGRYLNLRVSVLPIAGNGFSIDFAKGPKHRRAREHCPDNRLDEKAFGA